MAASSDDENKDNKPSLPDVTQIQENLRSGIRTTVAATNEGLHHLHSHVRQWQGPLADITDTVEKHTSQVAGQVMSIYDQRHEYALPIVATSTLLVGGVVGLRRRSRFSGLIGGALAGSVTYLALYNNPLSWLDNDTKKSNQ